MFEGRLEYLRLWWYLHGPNHFDSADDWLNSLTNVELLEVLSWARDEPTKESSHD